MTTAKEWRPRRDGKPVERESLAGVKLKGDGRKPPNPLKGEKRETDQGAPTG
jgi:hypothetical protein